MNNKKIFTLVVSILISIGALTNNCYGDLYNWGLWKHIPGKFKQIDVGSDGELWGVKASGLVYKYENNSWKKMPGNLKQISVGSKSKIWGTTFAGKVLMWDANLKKWIKKLGEIRTIYIITKDGSIYRQNSYY